MKKLVYLFSIGLLFSMSHQTIAQTILRGKVLDEEGLGLPGTTVRVKNTERGTISGADGSFQLSVNMNDTIMFSFSGYVTMEVAYAGQSTIEVQLQPDIAQLGEVVVVGYGTQTKSSLTGAVSTINSNELTNVPVSNTTNLLTGRAPGLITRQISSLPGSDGAAISIRGFDNPLVIIDGVPGNLATLDPNDIENISVLKDAAAAIYGVRAGDGVLLVTTKRGQEGKPTISLHTNVTIQNPTRFQNRVGAVDYLNMGRASGAIDPAEADALLARYENNTGAPDTDWFGAVFTDWTPLIQHNLSVSGSSGNIRYFASGGFQDQRSQFKSGDHNQKRYNGRVNLDADLSDKLSAQFNTAYIYTDLDRPTVTPADMFNLLATAQPIHLAELPDPNRAAYSGFLQRSPLAATQRRFGGFDDQNQDFLTLQGQLTYKLDEFIPGLSTRLRFNYQNNTSERTRASKPYEVWEYDPDPNTNTAATFPYILQGIAQSRSSVLEVRTDFKRFVTNFGLDYKRKFGDHDFTGLFMIETLRTNSNNISIRGFDLVANSIPFLVSADPSTFELSGNNGASESALTSYIGRLNYGYKNKLFLEATLRVDQSSLFAPGNRTGYFPSFSGAWTISNEAFMDNASGVNLLKVRASYSKVGSNTGIDPFQFLSTFQIEGGNYITGDANTIISTTGLANSDATWFSDNNYNLALEAEFLDGLIGVEFDYFYRLRDGLFARPIEGFPSTFGSTNILPALNLNDFDTRGIDLLLTHNNQINSDFSYRISATLTSTRSTWVEFQEDIPEDPEEAAIVQREGRRTNRFFGLQSDGLFQSQDEIDNHADQDENGNSTLRPGDIKYVDQNGDGVIDFKDNVEIGNGPFPDMSYAIDLGITYKNFTISALFQGASKFDTYITGAAAVPFSNESIPHTYHLQHSWTPDPNDPNVNTNPGATLPYITGVGLNQNSQRVSDFWLRPNDYFRLRQLNVSYNVPQRVLANTGIQRLNIYMAATNLFTLHRLGIFGDDFDPETRSGTIAGATGSSVNAQNGRSYPITKQITFGLRVTL